ncbi:MAG: thiamine phosphate synthase [Acidobacteria bacterium]|nr:thiamine phosphate synthase [Acidobacteriota bacterium]
MKKRLPSNRPLLYLITDRKSLPGGDLPRLAAEAAASGIDLIQVREKDLCDRDLCALVSSLLRGVSSGRSRLLVNDRFDIALACGAHGVHLTSSSIGASAVRPFVPEGFLIGVSTHSLEEVGRAVSEGADFALLGPIFDTPTKREYGPPLGPDLLRAACEKFRLPILGVGGIDATRIGEISGTHAAGLAAIRLFAVPGLIASTVERIRAEWRCPG